MPNTGLLVSSWTSPWVASPGRIRLLLANPTLKKLKKILSLFILIPHKLGRIPLLPFLFTVDDHVGARMICILSGDNDLTATVWRWRDRRRSWWLAAVLVVACGGAIGHSSSSVFSFWFYSGCREEDAKSTDGVAMGVSVASSGVLRRRRGLDWQRRMVVVKRWRRRLRVVACGGSVKVARLLGGGSM
ncbi:hypothetical protein LR48_Vigan09g132600 [Vigna angularis]|uniref:Uncharacterized protein n=1 Tax=Phaseolus angularis TaxID=3914 RepID=A0A0L9VCM1_PHAAN|nr:hypothetical protein LR48_Vigan09g132600 [Vigna angularis]